jgi:hypothetical protein
LRLLLLLLLRLLAAHVALQLLLHLAGFEAGLPVIIVV